MRRDQQRTGEGAVSEEGGPGDCPVGDAEASVMRPGFAAGCSGMESPRHLARLGLDTGTHEAR